MSIISLHNSPNLGTALGTTFSIHITAIQSLNLHGKGLSEEMQCSILIIIIIMNISKEATLQLKALHKHNTHLTQLMKAPASAASKKKPLTRL